VSSASPVAILATAIAAPITSAGRFSPLGPRGMIAPHHRLTHFFHKQLHFLNQPLGIDCIDTPYQGSNYPVVRSGYETQCLGNRSLVLRALFYAIRRHRFAGLLSAKHITPVSAPRELPVARQGRPGRRLSPRRPRPIRTRSSSSAMARGRRQILPDADQTENRIKASRLSRSNTRSIRRPPKSALASLAREGFPSMAGRVSGP
jgi:hypothetical protein